MIYKESCLNLYIVDLKNTGKDRLRCYFTGHISAGMAEPSSVIYGLETRVSWCILDLLQAPSDKLKLMLFLSCKHILLLGEPNYYNSIIASDQFPYL